MSDVRREPRKDGSPVLLTFECSQMSYFIDNHTCLKDWHVEETPFFASCPVTANRLATSTECAQRNQPKHINGLALGRV